MTLRLEIVLQSAELEPNVVKVELAQRVYRNLEAAGIFTDAATKNRVLNDLFSFVDTAALTTLKALNDEIGAVDAAALSLSKSTSDTASVSDVFTKTVTYLRQFTDAVAIDDVIEIAQIYSQTNNNVTFVGDVSDFVFTHPVTESIALAELHDFDFNQVQIDAVSAVDVAVINHYLGEGQIFNRPLFNQSTFG